MKNTLEALAEKLLAQRENQAYVKSDYAALMKAVAGEPLDAALNDNAEFTEAVDKSLSALRGIEKYCLEEKYLHGKSPEQLADEFRRNLDMENFADEIIENVYSSIKNEFMERIEVIFRGMEDNSFRELEYLDGVHPASLPKNDTYYELDADKSVVDILRDTLKSFNGMGLNRKTIFKNCFMKGQTKEELAEWLSVRMEEFIFDICCRGLRKLRIRYSRSGLRKFLGHDESSEYGSCHKDKCEKCIYAVTHNIGEEPEDCSKCKTAEVKEWLDKAISELPCQKSRVIRSLYDLEDGRYSLCNHKKTAVKFKLDSKEYVMKLERSALKALRKKAMRDFGKNN